MEATPANTNAEVETIVEEDVPEDMETSDGVETLPETEAVTEEEAADEAEDSPVISSSTTVNPPESQTYGPVRWDENLSSVVRKVQSEDSPWSLAQYAVALWKKNRDGFSRDNMSGLRAGTILDLPSADEIGAISVHDASEEFDRQWQEWKRAGSASTRQEKNCRYCL